MHWFVYKKYMEISQCIIIRSNLLKHRNSTISICPSFALWTDNYEILTEQSESQSYFRSSKDKWSNRVA